MKIPTEIDYPVTKINKISDAVGKNFDNLHEKHNEINLPKLLKKATNELIEKPAKDLSKGQNIDFSA